VVVLSGCGSGEKCDQGRAAGQRCSASASASGAGGDGQGGSTTSGGEPGEPSADCSSVLAPADGAVESVMVPAGSVRVDDVSALCDGSFVVSGSGSADISFERDDAEPIALSNATLWVARFAANGQPLWARAAEQALSDGSYVAPFPDASVALAGLFGTSATFGAGEANEVTLTAESIRLNGYVARYDSAGTLEWVKHIGPDDESRVWGVAARPDGTTLVALDSANTNGTIVDPDGIALELAGGDGALMALDAEGRFVGASLYTGLTVARVRLTVLDDGTLHMLGDANEAAVLAKGTPEEAAIGSAGAFLAHYDSQLQLLRVQSVAAHGSPATSSLLADGSSAFAGSFAESVTLAAGEPGEVTFDNAMGGRDAVISRLDAQGKLLWATQLGGEGAVDISSVTALPDGSVWIGGSYGIGIDADMTSTLELGAGTPGAITETTTGPLEFVARFAADGSPAWLLPVTGPARIEALSATPRSLIAVGEFTGPSSLGPLGIEGRGIFIGRVGP
jgi:hypothetical protein